MDNFVALDVETANNHPSSICSLGAVKVENGIITDRFYRLIRPYPNYYTRYNTAVHSLTREQTDAAAEFPAVWKLFLKWAGNLPFVAHNAQFDRGCINAAISHYGLAPDKRPFLCTLTRAKAVIPRTICGSFSLPHLASFLGIPFDQHHFALADAEACAKIAISLL